MNRGGSGVPCALWMSTVTISETGQASSLALALEIILMLSLLMLRCLFSLSEVLCLVCCDLWRYFDQAILTLHLSCFLPGPRQPNLHISQPALCPAREGCPLPLHSERRSPGACPGSPRKRVAAGAESLACGREPELPPAILYRAAPLIKKLWLPAHGGGLEAGGFNACKALYLSVAPFIPASQKVHHHHKKIIYSFISTR